MTGGDWGRPWSDDRGAAVSTDQRREVQVGDVVQLGGGTVLWEVTAVDPFVQVDRGRGPHRSRGVHLRSRRSGRTRSARGYELFWPGTSDLVDPWPTDARTQTHDRPACMADDGLSAAVITWDAPLADGELLDPSSVAVCVAHDSEGRRFVAIVADAPERSTGAAYLDGDAAVELGAALVRLGRGLSR